MASTDFVSPGSGGFGDQRISVPVSKSGGAERSYLTPHYFPRSVLKSGHAQVFRPEGFDIVVTGLNVVTQNIAAFDALLPGAIWVIQNRAGQEAVRRARINMADMKANDTFATSRSIHHFVMTTSAETITSVGPTTWYAPFIEYGFGVHGLPPSSTSKKPDRTPGPRPFMMQAAYDILPELIQAYVDLFSIGRNNKARIRSLPYKTPLEAYLAKWRQYLYTTEKALGDVMPLGGSLPGTSKARSGLLNTARIFGDVQSVMGRTVGSRISRRLTGKVTGRLIGVGSRSIFVNKTYTVQGIGGGERVYNRLAGRYTSKYNSSLSRLGDK